MVRFVSDLRGGNKNRNGDELLNNNGEGRWVNLDSYRNPGIEENEKEKRGGEEPMISPTVSRRAHAWHDAEGRWGMARRACGHLEQRQGCEGKCKGDHKI